MKPSKTADLRHLSDNELEQQIRANERALLDMRFSQAVGTLDNTAVVRTVRRDIARMKTILRERANESSAS